MALPAASSHCGAMPHATACAVSHAIGCRHLTVLLEPAMQHVGIHAMFTRRGGNGCPGLLACGDQFSLELRAVDPASAGDTGARIGNLLRHGVHDGLRGRDGACKSSFGVDGLAGRIQYSRGDSGRAVWVAISGAPWVAAGVPQFFLWRQRVRK